MNKTKVIGTIGPASEDIDILRQLIINGMDVARINLSHADLTFIDNVMQKIDRLNEELGTNVAVMIDTCGPTVRIGKFKNREATLIDNSTISIYKNEVLGDKNKFSTDYPGLIHDVNKRNIIKLDDGRIELEVIDKDSESLICNVIKGGTIKDNKSLNVPGVKLNLPFISEKDKEAIIYAHQHNADFIALSFVSSSEDVLEVNDLLIEIGNDHLGIISKIENERALEDIDNLIKVSDGIMVARGDLGVEIPFERIPGIQKSILHKCHIAGCVSIVATELLSTMEENIRPSRAEVSDVANAVLDGVDAVMLSGETTIGEYPVETMEMMSRIIESSEYDINYYDFLERSMSTEKQDITGNIAYSVVDCANRLKCKAIVAPTATGYTACKISRFRPCCPILALSPDINTVKSLSLHFGVHPIHVRKLEHLDKMIHVAKECVYNKLNEHEGTYILTGGYPFDKVKHTNLMRIEEL